MALHPEEGPACSRDRTMYLDVFIVENEVDIFLSPKTRPKKGYGISVGFVDICSRNKYLLVIILLILSINRYVF